MAKQQITTAQIATTSPAWTSSIPTITCSIGTFTTVSCQAYYTQLGKTVTYNGIVTITTVGTATGGMFIPLPITAARTNSGTAVGREFQTTGKGLTGTMDTTGRLYMTFYDNTSAWASGHKVQFSVTYEAA